MASHERMQAERVRRGLAAFFFMGGILIALVAQITLVVGLVVALALGFWWVLIGGAALLVLGVLMWFAGASSAMATTREQVDEAIRRHQGDQR